MTRPARVALYGGGGAPYHHAALFARAGHRIDFVFPVDIAGGCLRAYDAFVMPGGGYRAMSGQIDPLGHEGARAIREYVHAGGMYIGSCAGSYDAATVPASFVAACPAQADLCLLSARIWNETGTSWVGLQSPGVGVLRARNVAPTHPVMDGMPEVFDIVHYNGPLFRGGEALATVDGPTERFTPAEQFLTATTTRTLIDDAAASGVANIVVGRLGQGRVVLFGSHPEFGFSLSMTDPQLPARMLENAIRWQLEESGTRDDSSIDIVAYARPVPMGDLGERATRLLGQIRERCAGLYVRDDGPGWLQRNYAMSTFGLSPREIWAVALDEMRRLTDTIEQRVMDVDPWVLVFRQPAQWDLDGGFHGVVALLEQAEQMLGQARAQWNLDLGAPSADPYAFASTSPYHLVAGSYLAAIGRLASAALLCDAYQRVSA